MLRSWILVSEMTYYHVSSGTLNSYWLSQLRLWTRHVYCLISVGGLAVDAQPTMRWLTAEWLRHVWNVEYLRALFWPADWGPKVFTLTYINNLAPDMLWTMSWTVYVFGCAVVSFMSGLTQFWDHAPGMQTKPPATKSQGRIAFLPCDAVGTVSVIVILSVRPSVCHTRGLCPHGSTYDHDFFTTG